MDYFGKSGIVKSPLNYMGGKAKLLPYLVPMFPNNVDVFVDMFMGGANISVNVLSNRVHSYEVEYWNCDLFSYLKSNTLEHCLQVISDVQAVYGLAQSVSDIEGNRLGFNLLRDSLNTLPMEERHPLHIFVLTTQSFLNQLRYGANRRIVSSFGCSDSSLGDKRKPAIKYFSPTLRVVFTKFWEVLQGLDIVFNNASFNTIDLNDYKEGDFFYADPPYYVSSHLYNDGWTESNFRELLKFLDDLTYRGIKFGLSEVMLHRGIENIIMRDWANSNNYNVFKMPKNYSKALTGTIKQGTSEEVYISNYVN
jgi:site-specific DNA-adenine methylase